MKKTKLIASSVQTPAAKETSPPVATYSEAQRLAAAILEVLAGVSTPTAAATQLAISLPRYYQLETRALEGLVTALAPRRKGKQPGLENRIKQLEKELEAARRACARQEALVRITQRSLGLTLAKPKTAAPATGGKNRKQRRPVVRALRAARQLRSQAATSPAEETSVQPAAPHGVEEASHDRQS